MDNLEEMDTFLETYNFPRLSQEETENLNRLIATNEIKPVIKNFPKSKSPGSPGFTGKFYQAFKEELTSILLKLVQKFKKREGFLIFLQGQHYSDSETRQRYYKTREL